MYRLQLDFQDLLSSKICPLSVFLVNSNIGQLLIGSCDSNFGQLLPGTKEKLFSIYSLLLLISFKNMPKNISSITGGKSSLQKKFSTKKKKDFRPMTLEK